MRIKSKFKDYYDGAMSYGQDHSLLCLREVKSANTDNYPFPTIYRSSWDFEAPKNFSFSQGVVGFCGKVYPFIKITEGSYVELNKKSKLEAVSPVKI